MNNNEQFENFIQLVEHESHYDRFMYLKLFVVYDDELKEKYITHINEHNAKLFNKITEIDAGFDILTPKPSDSLEYQKHGGICCNMNKVNKVDFRIKCCAQMYLLNRFSSSNEQPTYINHNTGYYMYPRSSLSKTNLRLANCTGIIDSGYRGNLIGMFDALSDGVIIPYGRLIQICAPSLIPIYVELVNEEGDLGSATIRGTGGFGSTGL